MLQSTNCCTSVSVVMPTGICVVVSPGRLLMKTVKLDTLRGDRKLIHQSNKGTSLVSEYHFTKLYSRYMWSECCPLVGFEVFTTVGLRMAVIWVVAPCSLFRSWQTSTRLHGHLLSPVNVVHAVAYLC